MPSSESCAASQAARASAASSGPDGRTSWSEPSPAGTKPGWRAAARSPEAGDGTRGINSIRVPWRARASKSRRQAGGNEAASERRRTSATSAERNARVDSTARRRSTEPGSASRVTAARAARRGAPGTSSPRQPWMKRTSRHARRRRETASGSMEAEALQKPSVSRTAGTSAATRRAEGMGGPARPRAVSRRPMNPASPTHASPADALRPASGPGQAPRSKSVSKTIFMLPFRSGRAALWGMLPDGSSSR